MNLTSLNPLDTPTSLSPNCPTRIWHLPLPISETTPTRLRNLPHDLPPVPDGFVLWGWGPLNVTDVPPWRHVLALRHPETPGVWVSYQEGHSKSLIYAIRKDSQLAIDNGLVPAQPEPAEAGPTQEQWVKKYEELQRKLVQERINAQYSAQREDVLNQRVRVLDRENTKLKDDKLDLISLVSGIDTLKQENATLKKRLEREEMCHAACGAIANANTRDSLHNITKGIHGDYLSASVQDCIRATEREINLRGSLDAANTHVEILRKQVIELGLWKRDATIALGRWGKVVQYMAESPETCIGQSAEEVALQWLKERDALMRVFKAIPSHIDQKLP